MSTYIIAANFEDDEDGILYWSNEDGWGHRATATVFTEEQHDLYVLPLEAAGWVRVSPLIQDGWPEVMVDGPNLKWADNELEDESPSPDLADDDLFRCDQCGGTFDIEDSHRKDDDLLCPSCINPKEVSA